jgi:hypothetical protein
MDLMHICRESVGLWRERVVPVEFLVRFMLVVAKPPIDLVAVLLLRGKLEVRLIRTVRRTAHRAERLLLSALHLGRVSSSPSLQVEVLADGVVQQAHLA